MFYSSVGVGISRDAFQAGVEAALKARDGLRGAPVTLAIVFASAEFDQEVMLRGVQSVVGAHVPLAGASTAGEISGAGPSKTDSVVVMLLSTDTITISVSVTEHVSDSGIQTGIALYEELARTHNKQIELVTIFADGLTANPAEIIRGIEKVANRHIPIVGGSAGDNGKFVQTFQYCNGHVYSKAVVGMAFSGALLFAIGVRHGWVPIGTPKQVTAAQGTLIKEIDGRPAIELYEEYLGKDEAARLSEVTLGEIALSYPLGVRDAASGEMLLRAPFFVDTDGGITCGGEVMVGDTVQLMIGSRDDALKAAEDSARQAFDHLGAPPVAALVFSCHVRNTLFSTFEKSAVEVAAVMGVIGANVPLAGFYTYAEQAPVGGKTENLKLCKPNTLNETLVTVLLSEIP
jgi:hypothetical protein